MIRDRDGDAYGSVVLAPQVGTARMAMLISDCPAEEMEGVSVEQISPLITRRERARRQLPGPEVPEIPKQEVPDVPMPGLPNGLPGLPDLGFSDPFGGVLDLVSTPRVEAEISASGEEKEEVEPEGETPTIHTPTSTDDSFPAPWKTFQHRSVHESTYWNGATRPTSLPERQLLPPSNICGVVGDHASLIWKNDRFGSWIVCENEGGAGELRWWDVGFDQGIDGEGCAKVDLIGVGISDDEIEGHSC
jgi:hypothetical protein